MGPAREGGVITGSELCMVIYILYVIKKKKTYLCILSYLVELGFPNFEAIWWTSLSTYSIFMLLPTDTVLMIVVKKINNINRVLSL